VFFLLIFYFYPVGLKHFKHKGIVAGCDEAGRGCLAGPVFAASVVLAKDFYHPDLDDSKKMTAQTRKLLRKYIEEHAIYWSVAKVSPKEIDKINILNASFKAMHKSLSKLNVVPDHILVDGNRFNAYKAIQHSCIIKGDGKYLSIAAASVLAKEYRDDYMKKRAKKFPVYLWENNKGYPTEHHRSAIMEHGITEYHRKSFQLYPNKGQMPLFED